MDGQNQQSKDLDKNETDTRRSRNWKEVMEMDWTHTQKAIYEHNKKGTGMEPPRKTIQGKTQGDMEKSHGRGYRQKWTGMDKYKKDGPGLRWMEGICWWPIS